MFSGGVSVALLVAAATAIETSVGLSSAGIAAAILAPAMLTAGVFVPSSALDRFAKLLSPVSIAVLATPALCMIVQVLPIPVRDLGNPIWPTASAALNEPLADRLTVDVRATLLAFAQYNVVVATALVTAVVTLDRRRAAQFLYILLIIATCESAYLLLGRSWPPAGEPVPAAANSLIVPMLGILLAWATALREIDQIQHRHQPLRFSMRLTGALSIALLSFFICAAAIFARDDSTIFVPALLGVVFLLAVVTIHKWFLGIWGTAGVLATAALISIACLTIIPVRTNTDLTIALSRQNQGATERMLQDIGPVGSGAGAFNALLPIYRDIGNTSPRERPTDAAAIAVDMGRPFLCGLLVIVVLSASALMKRSLSRRRDYLYAAIGAGASVSLTLVAFSVDGLLDSRVSVFVAGLYGLAFGQSLPSEAREITSFEAHEYLTKTDNQNRQGRPMFPTPLGRTWGRVAMISFGLVLIAQVTLVFLTRRSSGDGFLVATGVLPQELFSDTTSTAPTPRENSAKGFRAAANVKTDAAPLIEPRDRASPSGQHAFARRLHYSPLRGDLWVLLAAISTENARSGYDTASLLKMSYYTAPNDLDLFPLRLSLGLSHDALVRDVELRDLVKRDLQVIVTRQPALKPALVAAYRSASADGKTFVEKLVSELDPSYVQVMRGPSQGLSKR